jgi:hypothetical protein
LQDSEVRPEVPKAEVVSAFLQNQLPQSKKKAGCFSPLQKPTDISSDLKISFQHLSINQSKLKTSPVKPPSSFKKSDSRLKKYEKGA